MIKEIKGILELCKKKNQILWVPTRIILNIMRIDEGRCCKNTKHFASSNLVWILNK